MGGTTPSTHDAPFRARQLDSPMANGQGRRKFDRCDDGRKKEGVLLAGYPGAPRASWFVKFQGIQSLGAFRTSTGCRCISSRYSKALTLLSSQV